MPPVRALVVSLAFGLVLASGLQQQAAAAAAPRYSIDLVGGWGQQAYGAALNERGQVTGSLYSSASGAWRGQAFVWDRQAGLRGLGTLDGVSSAGLGINDLGQVVGSYELGNGQSRAFIHDEAGMRALDTPGALNAWAADINAHGRVAGTVELAGGQMRPYVHDGTTMHLLDGPACCYHARAINDHGDIAGSSTRPGPYYPLVLSEGFVYLDAEITDVGHLEGGALSWANDINNSGQAVGTSDDASGELHGFLWSSATGMVELPTLIAGDFARTAAAINEHGDVVGGLYDNGDGRASAFIYADGKLTDLQDLLDPHSSVAWRLTEACDINDRGQILVSGYDVETFAHHSLLLTPVPEPETLALLLAGLGFVVMQARRR